MTEIQPTLPAPPSSSASSSSPSSHRAPRSCPRRCAARVAAGELANNKAKANTSFRPPALSIPETKGSLAYFRARRERWDASPRRPMLLPPPTPRTPPPEETTRLLHQPLSVPYKSSPTEAAAEVERASIAESGGSGDLGAQLAVRPSAAAPSGGTTLFPSVAIALSSAPNSSDRSAPAAPYSIPHRDRLVQFYRLHNPSRLATVDQVLEQYRGREVELFAKLEAKYNPTSQTLAQSSAYPSPPPPLTKEDGLRCFLDFTIDDGEGKGSGGGGRVVVELFAGVAPLACRNFATLCVRPKGRGYRNCIVHRIVSNFCVQTGDYTKGDGTGGKSIYPPNQPGTTDLWGNFVDETFLAHNAPGLLSMANSGPNRNSSQFFFTLRPLTKLDGKHVVFGRVVDGMQVLRTLEQLPCDAKSRPLRGPCIVDCGQLLSDGTEVRDESHLRLNVIPNQTTELLTIVGKVAASSPFSFTVAAQTSEIGSATTSKAMSIPSATATSANSSSVLGSAFGSTSSQSFPQVARTPSAALEAPPTSSTASASTFTWGSTTVPPFSFALQPEESRSPSVFGVLAAAPTTTSFAASASPASTLGATSVWRADGTPGSVATWPESTAPAAAQTEAAAAAAAASVEVPSTPSAPMDAARILERAVAICRDSSGDSYDGESLEESDSEYSGEHSAVEDDSTDYSNREYDSNATPSSRSEALEDDAHQFFRSSAGVSADVAAATAVHPFANLSFTSPGESNDEQSRKSSAQNRLEAPSLEGSGDNGCLPSPKGFAQPASLEPTTAFGQKAWPQNENGSGLSGTNSVFGAKASDQPPTFGSASSLVPPTSFASFAGHDKSSKAPTPSFGSAFASGGSSLSFGSLASGSKSTETFGVKSWSVGALAASVGGSSSLSFGGIAFESESTAATGSESSSIGGKAGSPVPVLGDAREPTAISKYDFLTLRQSRQVDDAELDESSTDSNRSPSEDNESSQTPSARSDDSLAEEEDCEDNSNAIAAVDLTQMGCMAVTGEFSSPPSKHPNRSADDARCSLEMAGTTSTTNPAEQPSKDKSSSKTNHVTAPYTCRIEIDEEMRVQSLMLLESCSETSDAPSPKLDTTFETKASADSQDRLVHLQELSCGALLCWCLKRETHQSDKGVPLESVSSMHSNDNSHLVPQRLSEAVSSSVLGDSKTTSGDVVCVGVVQGDCRPTPLVSSAVD